MRSSDETTARALFGIFRNGIEPNLLFSQSATEAAIQRAINRVESPLIRFRPGDILIERGTTLSSLDVERIAAYTAASPSIVSDATHILDAAFYERAFWTFVTLLLVAVYLKLAIAPHPKRNRAIAIAVIAIILNLALIRLVQSDALSALVGPAASAVLPFAAPIALGPILVAVLIGPAAAAMSAFIVSVLFGMMHGFGLSLTLAAFLSGTIAALLSGNVCQRSRIVRSSIFGGVVFALSALFVGVISGHGPIMIVQQMATAVLVGLLTGIIAIGILPFLENLFKVTTEITLLELTDFNHPILRRMQIEAPGTYHHSLMVSNLSENAAAAIGASPLLCRACSLFHDIGKLVKPEYFIENQRGLNPHDGRSPSMSALIIKAHVKEGVDLARKHKLPRIIMDVIRQHHGKSLIHYFYMTALKQRQQESDPEKAADIAREFDDSPYRYDGPKPQFCESAIIFFADSVEAASRTLKKAIMRAAEREVIDLLPKNLPGFACREG